MTFNKVAYCKKETPVQMFSCELWEIFPNSYSVERLQTAASGLSRFFLWYLFWDPH